MDDIMIDIETVGTNPGAAIVSIGAVRFSVDDGIDEELFLSVSLEDCQEHGLRIDAETLLWWLDQSEDARQQLKGGIPLKDALEELWRFCEGTRDIWANSPAFDCVILEHAYEAVGMDVPWEFCQRRDYRTIRDTRGVGSPMTNEQDGTEHDALDDARYQAENLIDALRVEEGVA